jgi:hypothetical protein
MQLPAITSELPDTIKYLSITQLCTRILSVLHAIIVSHVQDNRTQLCKCSIHRTQLCIYRSLLSI